MRRRFLVRSVAKQLPAGEQVVRAALMWNRHRWMPLFTATSFIALTVVATVAGFETWTLRLAVGLAGAAIAASATTRYRVLAQTSAGLVWLEGSRIRHRAVGLLCRLPPTTEIVRVGGNPLSYEWAIGEVSYSVTRSYDLDLQAIVESGRA